MTTKNCQKFGDTSEKLYGYATRRLRRGLEVVLCIPIIDNPVEFDVGANNALGKSETRLGDELRKTSQEVVIYTDKSAIPGNLLEDLDEVCKLIDYNVRFEMCVCTGDVMLPNAEYDGHRVQPVDAPTVNLCDHDYSTPFDFLESVLDYPSLS